MKNINTLLTLVALCFINVIFAQATATFNASATIIQPIGITTTSDLSFANLDAKNGGAVTLTPDNLRISEGNVDLAEGGNVSAAAFKITGQPGLTYAISIPSNKYVLTNGSDSMIISNFTTDATSNNILADGSQTIHIGATLNVKPNQMPGIYVSPARFNVTVNYN